MVGEHIPSGAARVSRIVDVGIARTPAAAPAGRSTGCVSPALNALLPALPNMADELHLTPDHRIAGVLIPVFALRSDSDQGIGDVGTLRRFISWAAETGFALVQLLPINETGGDNSPYNAISSMALDPSTLELTPEALEDLGEDDYRAELATLDLEALRVGPVQYSKVKSLKLRLLRRAFARFVARRPRGASSRFAAFETFRKENAGWLDNYVLFRSLLDRNGGAECWDRWPKGQQTAANAVKWESGLRQSDQRSLAADKSFYAYVQWVAYRQWEALKQFAHERGVGLMGDIPLGGQLLQRRLFREPGDLRAGLVGRRAAGTVLQG